LGLTCVLLFIPFFAVICAVIVECCSSWHFLWHFTSLEQPWQYVTTTPSVEQSLLPDTHRFFKYLLLHFSLGNFRKRGLFSMQTVKEKSNTWTEETSLKTNPLRPLSAVLVKGMQENRTPSLSK
jgi:hypothetical protein